LLALAEEKNIIHELGAGLTNAEGPFARKRAARQADNSNQGVRVAGNGEPFKRNSKSFRQSNASLPGHSQAVGDRQGMGVNGITPIVVVSF
jgi:hypothetical protein